MFVAGYIEMGLEFSVPDFYVITYSWTNGSSLTTRFRLNAPPVSSEYMGENAGVDELPFGSGFILRWGGNTVGFNGQESILFNRQLFSQAYPNTTSVTFDVRGMYAGVAGTEPVIISVVSYVGGTMQLALPIWTNSTYTQTRSDYPTYSEVVTIGFDVDPLSIGQDIATLNINFFTDTVSFS